MFQIVVTIIHRACVSIFFRFYFYLVYRKKVWISASCVRALVSQNYIKWLVRPIKLKSTLNVCHRFSYIWWEIQEAIFPSNQLVWKFSTLQYAIQYWCQYWVYSDCCKWITLLILLLSQIAQCTDICRVAEP